MLEPEFVEAFHEITIRYAVQNLERLLPAINPYVDVYQCASDDWGSQNQTFAPPHIYERLFLPYYRRFNDAIHALAPNVKTFMHNCGAGHDIIDLIIESGFDIFNPVQWTAGGRSYKEWKDKCRNRIALWGGGINSQKTLPLGTINDVEREVREVVRCLRQDGGFVFCGIHNILAEIPEGKIVAMYRAAKRG